MSEIILEVNKLVKESALKEMLVTAQTKVDNIRTAIANILSKAKIPKQNIDKQDRENVKHLAKNEDILTLPAGKANAAMVMEKEEYNSKLNKIVSDTKVYQKLKSDPTPMYQYQVETLQENNPSPVLPPLPHLGHDPEVEWIT